MGLLKTKKKSYKKLKCDEMLIGLSQNRGVNILEKCINLKNNYAYPEIYF